MPSPVIIFTTPSGKPACSQSSANNKAVNEVVSAGFKTTVLPVAKAGATFHANINNGKFHGIICPTTPCGFKLLAPQDKSILSAQPAK